MRGAVRASSKNASRRRSDVLLARAETNASRRCPQLDQMTGRKPHGAFIIKLYRGQAIDPGFVEHDRRHGGGKPEHLFRSRSKTHLQQQTVDPVGGDHGADARQAFLHLPGVDQDDYIAGGQRGTLGLGDQFGEHRAGDLVQHEPDGAGPGIAQPLRRGVRRVAKDFDRPKHRGARLGLQPQGGIAMEHSRHDGRRHLRLPGNVGYSHTALVRGDVNSAGSVAVVITP